MPRPPSRKRGSSLRTGKKASPIPLASQLLEAIPDAIVGVDQNGTIVQINAQTETLFGYTREELIGKKVEILIPERHHVRHSGHRADFSVNPRVRQMGAGLNLHGRRKDGSEFAVEISLSPVSTEDGVLVLSAIRDVSERKRIEEELSRANAELNERTNRQLWEYRARLASIIDSSEDAIIGKDLNGIVTSWNRGAEHVYGYSAEEMVGNSIAVISPADRSDEIPGILKKIRRGETVSHFESVRVTKDGRHLNISLTVSPIRDAQGTIVGASAIGRDITAHKRAEDQLRQAQKMEAIGRLAGGVAHDFNNILGIITACVELLEARIDPKAAPQQYIDNVRKAAERGATLTRQLLAFSRQQVVQTTVLDLNARLRETSKLLRPLMGDDVEVIISRRSSAAVVEGDPVQLDQVILNLAVNARDAMPKGGKLILETSNIEMDETMAAQHAPLTAGKYVQLTVSDTGTGMDSATAARIFEPFFTTKDVGKGTGLGLAMVYGIVRQSNGHILVYSEPGRGTTFKIYLPSAENKIGLSTPGTSQTLPRRRPDTTILLVEDDEMMRMLTKQLLVDHGYNVIEASDGASALGTGVAGDKHIDVLLTDVVMRGISGPELVRQLASSRPKTKVIFMSGYTGELLSEHDVFQAGTRFLEKPFSRASLLKMVDAALEEAE
jgi:PAS domain S-box-containing protein